MHSLITGPSILWHGLINVRARIKSSPSSIPNLQNKDVIVLVHGLGGHYTNFNVLISNLKKELHQEIVAVDLGDNRHTTIDTDVSTLQSLITSLENCNITLIGLSKGGLVVMKYITSINDLRIKNVITISSPLRGTLITKFLCPTSLANIELGYNSKITTQIRNSMCNINTICNIYHIVPRYDHIIIPTSSAYYETTPNDHIHYCTGYYSHIGISASNEVSDAIITWIRK